ncbi:MAG TPA: TonB-dependent receptor plug domain-containing protein, partial [Opitutaceae bacterium]|nr:TonB-dependent receptor plug domain-containing protein [Opitutaceae bacterium]
YAENTLAGSRLNTNVGDLASSITVVTKQQLDDTGALNINDVFLYEANTEGAGTYTPLFFGPSGATDMISGYSTNNGPTFGIAQANRVRGLGSADTAQDNYPTLPRLPFDSYNTNSVEINRGPNALLFGAASPSGVANQSTAEAVLNQQKSTVSVRFGSFGAHRESISTNIPVGHKVALFFAALHDDKEYERKPSGDVTRRQYAAITYQPFTKTKLTASFENYDNYNHRPNFNEPYDGISPWLAAGKPGWDPTTQTITLANGTKTGPYLGSTLDPRWAANTSLTVNGMGAFTSSTSAGYIPGIVGAASEDTIFVNGGHFQSFWVSNAQEGAGVNGATAIPAVTARTAQQWINASIARTQSTNFPTPVPPASTGATGYAVYYNHGITDKSLYDWTKYNFAGASYGTVTDKNYKIELNQNIMPGLDLQLGWFRQEMFEWDHYDAGEGNDIPNILIDTNTKLMDGRPNPFFGAPYAAGTRTDTFSSPETNNNLRAMLAYEHDFTKAEGWGRYFSFLGKARLMALATQQKDVIIRGRWRFTMDGGDPRFLMNQNPVIPNNFTFGNNKNMQRNYYMGTGADGRVTQGVTKLGEPNFGGPGKLPLEYFDWNSTQTWQTTQMSMDDNLFIAGAGQGETAKTLNSTSFAYQGSLWENRIVPTLGTRYDKTRVYQAALAAGATAAIPTQAFTTNGFANYEALKIMNPVPYDVGADTTTRGIVVRPFSNWRQIDAAADRGNILANFVRGLSFHYNHSDNFQPPQTIQTDMFGTPLPKPSGKGDDYGIGGSMFNNKLSWNLNWYKSTAEYAVSDAANLALTRAQRIDTSSMFVWAREVVRIRHGENPNDTFFDNNTTNPLTTQEQTEINALVAGPEVKKAGGPVVSAFSVGNNIAWPNTDIEGTNSQLSKGKELTLIYNPTRNWNIKLTAGQQFSSYSKASSEISSWLYGSGNANKGDGRLNFWQTAAASDLPTVYTRNNGNKLYLGDFWNSYGYTGDANSNTSGATSTPKTTYNSIVNSQLYALFGLQNQRSPSQREYSSSLITNYAFQEGRLKGIAVGGGLRWASNAVAGYYANLDPATFSQPSATQNLISYPDLTKPHYIPATTNVDVWASYTTRLPFFGRSVRAKFQVNVQSLTEKGGLQPLVYDPDGTAANYRIVDPRTFFVTSTFDF